MEVKTGSDEEMRDDIDSVRDLLDRLKEEKERELLKETSSSSVQENGISSSEDSKQDAVIGELQKKSASLVMNLKSVVKTKESPTKAVASSQRDATLQDDHDGDSSNKVVPQKRKQDSFLVEVQERAEVISKSARKAPETMVSSIRQNVEDDPDTEEFLRKIRAAPSTSSDFHVDENMRRVHRSKSLSEVDFSAVVSNSSTLNLEPQKSKIPLGRSGSLKGRRRPSVAGRRKSLKPSFNIDWEDSFVICEEEESESMDEEFSDASNGSFIIKDPPQMAAESEVRPRTKPKPKVKSQTVSGIALPGLAEVLSKKKITALDKQRSQGSAADVVRAAAESKRNMAAKEERVKKEPEKPAWLVEAEERKKLHEQRRHNKTKQQGENDREQDKLVQNGSVLHSLPHRHEAVIDKSDSNAGVNLLHNVALRPVRKVETVATKSDDDNNANKSFSFCLRPVSKPDPVESQVEERSDGSRHHNVFLRPIHKSEPVVNAKSEDLRGKFQPVRLKPIVYPHDPRPSGSTISDNETVPMATRISSELMTPSSHPVRPVMQSFSNTVTSSRVPENGVVLDQSSRSAGAAKNSSEHHSVRSLAPITSTASEDSQRVTVSSNYVSAPHKITPKSGPKPSNRSKTVTVTASEVPDPSKARRTSVELIHAKVERKSSRPVSSTSPSSHVTSPGGLWGPRRGSDTRERVETFDSSYRPTYTGDVLPQWKIDLIEKKKNAGSSRRESVKDQPHQTHTSNVTAVPAWKRELAEKRKQRVVNGVQTSNKENEPKTSPVVPQWKKEFAERRKREEMSPTRMQPDKREQSPETPEWQRRLANTRRTQPIVVPRGPVEDSTDQIPSFMKEFERKKRTLPRGGSYV